MSGQRGYYRVEPIDPNIYRESDLAAIVEQLDACGYRCEAGGLENNLAFIELKRRAEIARTQERAAVIASRLFELSITRLESGISQEEYERRVKEIIGTAL